MEIAIWVGVIAMLLGLVVITVLVGMYYAGKMTEEDYKEAEREYDLRSFQRENKKVGKK